MGSHTLLTGTAFEQRAARAGAGGPRGAAGGEVMHLRPLPGRIRWMDARPPAGRRDRSMTDSLARPRGQRCAPTTAAATRCRPRGSIRSSGTGIPPSSPWASPPSTRPRLAGDRAPAGGPVGRRPGPAHRLPCPVGRLFPRPGGVGNARTCRRPPASRSRRCWRPPRATSRRRARPRRCRGAAGGDLPRAAAPAIAGGSARAIPGRSGLVATLHPWESGMDNSPAWDAALARVPHHHHDPDPAARHRPCRCRHAPAGRGLSALHPSGRLLPRRSAGTRRGCWRRRRSAWPTWHQRDPAARRAGPAGARRTLRKRRRAGGDRRARRSPAPRHRHALESRRWAMWTARDLIDDTLVDGRHLGRAAAAVRTRRHARAAPRGRCHAANAGRTRVRFLVPSTDPGAPGFEPLRYWRGPVWAMMNWMIADGLDWAGEPRLPPACAPTPSP